MFTTGLSENAFLLFNGLSEFHKDIGRGIRVKKTDLLPLTVDST
jgi:hypothetical protein